MRLLGGESAMEKDHISPLESHLLSLFCLFFSADRKIFRHLLARTVYKNY